MDRASFENSPSGRVVAIKGYDNYHARNYEHIAFVPNDLNPEIPLKQRTYKRVSEAALALGRLDSAAEKLPNPQLLVRPALHKEAQSTSALEGTHATLFDVLEAEYVETSKRSSQVAEVLNYVEAATEGLAFIEKRAISTSVVAELQATLVKGTRGGTWDAGKLRTTQVYLAGDRPGIENSRFVPAPEGHTLQEGMNAWESWINEDDDIPLIVKAAMGHYQFETLHPFTDGNGRIGRLIVVLQLVDKKALKYPILNLSSFLEPRKERYKDLLLQCSQTGEFDEWIQFFCDAVETQANDEVSRIDELLDLRVEILDKLRGQSARGVVLEIVDDLIAYPVITPSQAASLHNVTYPPANNAIQKLVELGYLTEATGQSYGRIYVCQKVMRIVDGR